MILPNNPRNGCVNSSVNPAWWHGARQVSLARQSRINALTTRSKKDLLSPSNDRAFVYAQLVRNMESAFIKLRRHQHRCGELFIALRYRDYQQRSLSAPKPTTDSTQEILPIVHTLFDQLFASGVLRATQIWLSRLGMPSVAN